MKYSGICHTQLNEISGILGKDKHIPHCMGHEGVGEIISLSKNSRKFKIGDWVVVSWIKKKIQKNFLLHIICTRIKRLILEDVTHL